VISIIGRKGRMENVGTRSSGGHDERDFSEVHPSLVTERFGPWVLLDIVIPGRGRVSSNAGAGFFIPDPAWDWLNCADDTVYLAKLSGYEWSIVKRTGQTLTAVHLFRQAFTVFMAPLWRKGARWPTTRWYVVVLKLPPSPASALWSTRKSTKADSLAEVQTAPAGIAGSFGGVVGVKYKKKSVSL